MPTNAVTKAKGTALHLASKYKRIRCTLHLLCVGAEIDENAIKEDKTKFLEPIENALMLLRDGKRTLTSLMSKDERRFMWNLACVLAIIQAAIAFGTYERIRSFVTFHGIFMGYGYDVGEGSIWRKKNDKDYWYT